MKLSNRKQCCAGFFYITTIEYYYYYYYYSQTHQILKKRFLNIRKNTIFVLNLKTLYFGNSAFLENIIKIFLNFYARNLT